VKREKLLKKLKEMGCIFTPHGGRHDWYQNPRTRVSQPVPRHREINDQLARHIIKLLSNDS
jgi:mRNA interferase HicA